MGQYSGTCSLLIKGDFVRGIKVLRYGPMGQLGLRFLAGARNQTNDCPMLLDCWDLTRLGFEKPFEKSC